MELGHEFVRLGRENRERVERCRRFGRLSGAELGEPRLTGRLLPPLPEPGNRKRAVVREGYPVGLFAIAAVGPLVKAVDWNETPSGLVGVGETSLLADCFGSSIYQSLFFVGPLRRQSPRKKLHPVGCIVGNNRQFLTGRTVVALRQRSVGLGVEPLAEALGIGAECIATTHTTHKERPVLRVSDSAAKT